MSLQTGSRVAITTIGIAALLSLAPAIFFDRVLSGDAHIHVRWQAHIAPLIWRGELYPRWLPEMNGGFGSPAFFIYPPLLQWTGALFYPLIPNPGQAEARIALAMLLWAFGGATACRQWLRSTGVSSAAALFGAMLFIWLPYRAYFDIYQRGALAEVIAISALPFVLLAIEKVRQPGITGPALCAAAFAALLYANAPTALIAAPFFLLYGLVRLAAPSQFLSIFAGVIAGAGLAAPYLSTSLTQTRLIRSEALFAAKLQPQNYLLFAPTNWPDHGIQLIVSVLTALDLGLVILLGWAATRQAIQTQRHIAYLLSGTVALTLLLMLEPFRPFWTPANPFFKIQFPFRLLALHCIALPGLGALAWDAFSNQPEWRKWTAGLILLSLALVDIGLFAAHVRYGRERPRASEEIVASSRDPAEYVVGDLDSMRGWFGNHLVVAPGANVVRPFLPPMSRALVFDIDARRPTWIALHQFAYSGWTCRIDQSDAIPAANLAEPLRIPSCPVPAGRHRLYAELAETWQERIGNRVSLVALLLLLGALVMVYRRRSRQGIADRA